MTDFFTYQGLKKFLTFLKKEREITSFAHKSGSNAAILRHDVDLSVEMAYEIAVIEKEMQITSTFFFMVTATSYNPMTKENQQLIKKIADWGFEIGLHFDPTIYKQNIPEALEAEANILNQITGKKVKTYSLHNPSISHCFDVKHKKFVNVYDKKLFHPDYYISDSLMKFKKDIYEFVRNTKDHQIQILLHPLHFHKKIENYAQIYSEVFTHLIQITDKNFQDNPTYRADIGTNLLDCFVRNSSQNQRKKQNRAPKD